MQDRLQVERIARLNQAVLEVHRLGVPDHDPEAAYLIGTLAQEFLYARQPQRALELLDTLAQPTWAESYLKGLTYCALEQTEQALEEFDRAVLAPEASTTAWFHYGVTLGQLGRVDEEEQAYRKVLELDPTYYEAWFNLGLHLEDQGILDKALSSYERCLEHASDFYPAHNASGRVLGLQERYEEAAAAFTNAIQANPEYWEAWYQLSYTLDRLGLVEESQAAIKHIPAAYLTDLAAESLQNGLAADVQQNLSAPPKDAQNWLTDDLAQAKDEDYADTYGYKFDEFVYDDAPEVDVAHEFG